LTHTRFRTVYYREMANSFGIWDPPDCSSLSLGQRGNVCPEQTHEQEWIGFSIYPTAVYFNHSCSPNIRKLRVGREMQFLSDRNIQHGEELLISYGSISDTVDDRQDRLLQHFFFKCTCERCITESAA
ncbi:SET domain-containing protein, partial [Martensiomyces pterosporus]